MDIFYSFKCVSKSTLLSIKWISVISANFHLAHTLAHTGVRNDKKWCHSSWNSVSIWCLRRHMGIQSLHFSWLIKKENAYFVHYTSIKLRKKRSIDMQSSLIHLQYLKQTNEVNENKLLPLSLRLFSTGD